MIFFDDRSGEYGYLSNDEQAGFSVGRGIFSSMTQYMAYCKARLFGDMKTANAILNEWNPDQIRAKERDVKGFDEREWNSLREILLYRGLTAKFCQNPEMATALVKTGTELLVFLGPHDPVLGIGLYSFSDERFDMEQWKGENHLGYALMHLRSDLQYKMPEGIRRKLQNRLEEKSLADLTGAFYGEDYREYTRDERKICRYQPYEGDDPYIYLNYDLCDIELAYRMAEALNRMGFNVWYDKYLPDGRMWTSERSDAIEGCTVLIDIENGNEKMTHARLFGIAFAEELELPVITAYMHRKYARAESEVIEPQEDCIKAGLQDKRFEGLCKKALELNGLLPGMKNPEGAKKEPKWDLGINYYDDYNGGVRLFGAREEWKFCNIRTREVFYTRHRRVYTEGRPRSVQGRTIPGDETPLYLSDEEVYRYSVWLRRSFDIIRKSSEPEYVGSIDDWAFSAKLRELDGGEIKSIAREYQEAKKRYDQWVQGYPYMDEFEYINSRFEDE